MAKFLFLYRGPATPVDQFTSEQGAEQLKAWGDWIAGVGSALVDAGAPFGARTAVKGDGSTGTPSDQNGYSIVEADGLEGAQALIKGHPFLVGGDNRFSVEVFELTPMAM
jgi:hypothetical protein